MVDVALLTNPMTTAEDLIVGDTGGAPKRLAKGSPGQFLRVSVGGVLEWATTAGVISYVRKTADESKSSTSLADSTGMGFAVLANKVYKFRYVVFFNTNDPSVGIKLSVNGPAGTYRFGGYMPVSAGSGAGNAATFNSGGVADSAAFSGQTGPGTGSNPAAVLEGIAAIGGTGGTLILRHGSETATATTILANSFGELVEIA